MLIYNQGRGKSPKVICSHLGGWQIGEKRMKISYYFEGKKIEWEVVGEKNLSYSTNDSGRGIFQVRDGERHQLMGTAQFSVAGITKNSARAKIRKFMSTRTR